MTKASKIKMGHVTWPHPLCGGLSSLSRTCFYEPTYQIWSRYFQQLRIYKRRYKM